MFCLWTLFLFFSITYRYASFCVSFFFFNDTATTEIYTLSLHDALPISARWRCCCSPTCTRTTSRGDRKSTRLNSSHTVISYAVFCLKKKKKTQKHLSYKRKKTNENRIRTHTHTF